MGRTGWMVPHTRTRRGGYGYALYGYVLCMAILRMAILRMAILTRSVPESVEKALKRLCIRSA